MSVWKIAFALPNIRVEFPVETHHVALVSAKDDRIRNIAKLHKNVAHFVSGFKDTFGDSITPGLLIYRTDPLFRFLPYEAMTSFRDIIAMSVVPLQISKQLNSGRPMDLRFSDYFDFYPWHLDNNYNYVRCNNVIMLGVHDVNMLNGQSAPGISQAILSEREFDFPLLGELKRRWVRRYLTKIANWADLALFRSLDMAMAAARVPAGHDATLAALGRNIALWISSFETLVHPKTARSELALVYDLLEKKNWTVSRCGHRRYAAYVTRKMDTRRRVIACWVYGELHRARNDFLHGNALSSNRLSVGRYNRNLFYYSAPLYRIALSCFLPLVYRESKSPPTTIEENLEERSRRRDFLLPEMLTETALLTISQRNESYSEKMVRMKKERMERLRNQPDEG